MTLLATNYFTVNTVPLILAASSSKWWLFGEVITSNSNPFPSLNISIDYDYSFLPVQYFDGPVLAIEVVCPNCTRLAVTQ